MSKLDDTLKFYHVERKPSVKAEIKALFLELIGEDQAIQYVHHREFVESKWKDDLRAELRRKVSRL